MATDKSKKFDIETTFFSLQEIIELLVSKYDKVLSINKRLPEVLDFIKYELTKNDFNKFKHLPKLP